MKKYLFSIILLAISFLGVAQGTYNVTFQVDMKQYTGAYTTPEVNGDFNGWCGNCNAMSDANNDSVWDITLPITADSIEFKFAHDNWAGQEALTAGTPCTKTTSGFTNRFLVLTADTVLSVVCWDACTGCSGITPPSKAMIDLPITWDDTANVNYNAIDFGGNSSMLAPDPNDPTNLVLMSDKTSGAMTWAGTSFGSALATAIPFSPGNTVVKALVYSPDMGIQVRLKVEDSTDPTISVETEATTTVANAWDTLTFDFANEAMGTSPISFVVTYDKMSIFYNFGVSPANTSTYYVDFVDFAGTPPPIKSRVGLPITWDDTTNVDYTTIDFAGNSSMVAPDPNNAANLVLMTERNTSALVYAGSTFGPSLTAPVPFSTGNTIIMARVYSPVIGSVVKLKVEDQTDPTKSVETDFTTTVANAWDTLTFDFANESAGTPALNLSTTYDKMTIFYNFGVDGATAGIQTYYVDDVVFGSFGVGLNENVLVEKLNVYPNPAQNTLHINKDLSNAGVLAVEIVNALGQTVYSQQDVDLANGTLDISMLENGFYFINIKSDTQLFSSKVLVSK